MSNEAFRNTKSLVMSNLTSLESIEFGNDCFQCGSSFSLIGMIDLFEWLNRFTFSSISYAWSWCIPWCSFGCVWEWLNGWVDYSDLPKLQSIQLDSNALEGDYRADRKTIDKEPYNLKNILTMRSEIERTDKWIDLPLLIEFKGNGSNFGYIGSVILESNHLVIDWT